MKKSLKILIAAAMVLCFQFSALSSARAQFAGEDKKVAREPGNTQKVSIGTPDAANDVCYMWTGPHIDGNANQAVVTVNPHDTLETYMVKRISKNGIEEDEVKVRVEDSIAIVSVKAKYKCYNHGDNISPSQFEIETEPAGYESLVTVSPTTATNSAGLGIENNCPLTFTLNHNGHTSTKTLTTTVYNSDLVSPLDLMGNSISTIYMMVKNMKTFQEIWDNLESVANIVNYLTEASPCGWKNPKPQDNVEWVKVTPKMLCCGHVPAYALQIQFAKLSYGNSFGCRFPFYGIPYVASADIVFNLSAEIFAGPVTGIISTNDSCGQVCIPVGVTLAVNGGVGVSVGGGKILAADLLLQGATTAQAQWCPIGANNSLSVGITFSVVGSVTALGMIEHTIEYPLATYSMSVDL